MLLTRPAEPLPLTLPPTLPDSRSGPVAVLGAGLLYGILHFALQGKGWEYHLYPLALFASALGGTGLDAALLLIPLLLVYYFVRAKGLV